MNITKLLLVAFAIHLTLIISGVAAVPLSSLYQFLVNPTLWKDTSFLLYLTSDLLTVAATTGILIATVATRSDIWIFLSVATLFLSFGLPLAVLWKLIETQSNITLASILVSPIILIYVVTVVQFWRGRA